MAYAVVQVAGSPVMAEIVKESAYTLWVRLRDGQVVKRHWVKHGVGLVQEDTPKG